METPEVLNKFFSNIVKGLKILQYSNFGPILQNIKDSTLKVPVKYKIHRSVVTIQAKYKCKNNLQKYLHEILKKKFLI